MRIIVQSCDTITHYIIFARNVKLNMLYLHRFIDTTIRDVGQSVAIGDKHFEVVKEFVYPDDTNERRESGNTTKNPDCK
jgi:acetone carboxylase gamma subunit